MFIVSIFSSGQEVYAREEQGQLVFVDRLPDGEAIIGRIYVFDLGSGAEIFPREYWT